MKTISEIDY